MEIVLQLASRFAKLITKKDVNIPIVDFNSGTLSSVLSIVFGLAGGVALIVIIIGGIKFITSQGEPQALARARNTIIYAIVGLIVCIAAFSIVSFTSGNLG